jgi:hypothetical protein
MYRLVALTVLLALALASCGSDDDLSEDEAQEVVAQVKLDAGDLGDGWQQTASEEPADDDGGDDEDDELEECLGDDAASFSEELDDPLAESTTDVFALEDSATDQHEVTVETVVVDDEDAVDEAFGIIGSSRFSECFAELLEEEVSGQEEAGVDMTLGEITTDNDFADADRSVVIQVPFDAAADGNQFDGQFTFGFVNNGQVVSTLLVFSLGEPISDGEIRTWSNTLSARQQEAA